MNNLTDEQKKEMSDKIEKLKPFVDKQGNLDEKSMMMYEEVQKMGENVQKIADKPEMEMPDCMKVQIEGAEVVTIKGEKGDSPTDEHLVELITPLIPEPIPGKDYILTEKDKKEIASKIEVPIVVKEIETIIEKQPIITNEIKEVAVTDTSDQIIEKINTSEEQIDKERIKGLEDEIKKLGDRISSIPKGGGGGARGGIQLTDLSSQTNGSLKVFSVPKNKSGFIIGSDFPTVLMEGNGFTLNGSRTQLTLQTENAPSTNSQLLFVSVSFFNIL